MPDINGNRWAHEKTCKIGDKIIADAGFTCIPEGTVCHVWGDRQGLFVRCQGEDQDEPVKGKARRQRHYLDGQLNEYGEYVGFYHMSEANFVPHKVP